jgi:periplasmic divalent cation tolerance protein
VSDVQLVLVTCAADQADALAAALVRERLAACVSAVRGVASTYRWKGRVRRDPETLLLIKTRRALLKKLRARVVELHRYEVPEVIAVALEGGHAPYLDWVRRETSGA